MVEAYADDTYEHSSDTELTPARETLDLRYVTHIPCGTDVPIYVKGGNTYELAGYAKLKYTATFVGDQRLGTGDSALIVDDTRGIAVPDYDSDGPRNASQLFSQQVFAAYAEFLDSLQDRVPGLPPDLLFPGVPNGHTKPAA